MLQFNDVGEDPTEKQRSIREVSTLACDAGLGPVVASPISRAFCDLSEVDRRSLSQCRLVPRASRSGGGEAIMTTGELFNTIVTAM
jgi:hypothetical protein